MKTPHPRNMAMGEALRDLANSLKSESDRGTIVLAVAWLDESLTKILSNYLKSPPSTKENLLLPGQPLGDFGTKIILAHRLNLINDHIAESLTICRKLRNDFAHIASELSFNTQSVKDRVNNLFQLNEEVIRAMGETLADANLSNLAITPDDSGSISIKDMHDLFGTKDLFRYLCGFINSGLAGIKYGLERSSPNYEIRPK